MYSKKKLCNHAEKKSDFPDLFFRVRKRYFLKITVYIFQKPIIILKHKFNIQYLYNERRL